MRSSTPDVAERAGEILVEAPTARQALEEVTSRLGPRATIVEASKVTRGGVGGFFAREMIQLRAQAPDATYDGRDDPTVTTTAGEQASLDRLLTDLSSEVGEREETFATALRRHLGTPTAGAAQAPGEVPAASPPVAGPPAASPPVAGPSTASPPAAEQGAATVPPAAPGARPEPPPAPLADDAMGFQHALAAVRLGAAAPGGSPAPAASAAQAPAATAARAAARVAPPAVPAAAAPHWSSGPDWSADRLLRLGLPAALLAGWPQPRDDLDGLVALARLVAPLCGPLPPGPALVAGPRAHRLADPLGAAVVTAAEPPPPAGTVCARLNGSERARAWLDAHRRGRWLHLVAGGSGWQRLLLAYPFAVSWWGAEALPDALRVASELGVPLAYGSAGTRGARLEPATPTAVAVAVRDLLVTR